MYRILLDTTERAKKIVTLEDTDGKVVGSISGDIDPVGSIKELLSKNNIELDNVKSFDYAKGPGSYTGLRIGAAVANVLEWLKNDTDISDLPLPEYGSEPNITEPKKPQVLTGD